MRRAFALLVAATATLYAALLWQSIGVLIPAADGALPFDMRMFGYTPAAALTYVDALPEATRLRYLGPVRLLDTGFPVALGLMGGAVIWWGAAGWHVWSKVVMMVIPGAYVLMDLAENALVAQMLRGGVAGFDTEVATLASGFTVTKFVLVAATGLAALAFAVRRGLRRRGQG